MAETTLQNTVLQNTVLQNTAPPLNSEQEIRDAIEMAFSYRGDITLGTRDGSTYVGYIFDREAQDEALSKCTLRMMFSDSGERCKIAYSDVTSLVFSGRDTAAGKSFETWVRKYNEKKAAGEKNISIEPEAL